jgi:hypothetical protein
VLARRKEHPTPAPRHPAPLTPPRGDPPASRCRLPSAGSPHVDDFPRLRETPAWSRDQ